MLLRRYECLRTMKRYFAIHFAAVGTLRVLSSNEAVLRRARRCCQVVTHTVGTLRGLSSNVAVLRRARRFCWVVTHAVGMLRVIARSRIVRELESFIAPKPVHF